MCLVVPVKTLIIEHKFEGSARMVRDSFGCIIKEGNVEKMREAKGKDYALLQVGVAISVVDEKEAKNNIQYLGEMNEVEQNIGAMLPEYKRLHP